MIIKIKNRKNQVFKVFLDKKDYNIVKKYSLWIDQKKQTNYVCLTYKKRHAYLHRLLLNVINKKVQVDHINGNGLDNRRKNLRSCTRQQNLFNQKITDKNINGYKGVSKNCDKRSNTYKIKPWRARIKFNYESISLGSFKTKKEAALAYNKAALKYYGEFACLNKL